MEADTTTGNATKRISRGIKDKVLTRDINLLHIFIVLLRFQT
jgi:hypothetical protein